MHPAKDGFAALPFFDDFDLSTVDILLISQYVKRFFFRIFVSLILILLRIFWIAKMKSIIKICIKNSTDRRAFRRITLANFVTSSFSLILNIYICIYEKTNEITPRPRLAYVLVFLYPSLVLCST